MNNDQVTKAETETILRLAEQCLDVAGDFVELGCYRGDTSVLLGKLLQNHAKSHQTATSGSDENCGKLVEKMSQTVENHHDSCAKPVHNSLEPVEKPCKTLWIYDSFAGLPAKTTEDASGAGANFQAGELLVTKREVVQKIRKAGLHNVIIKKAWFDELVDAVLPENIAFAFLDGDLYGSIKTSLKLVAPRLAKPGIMIVHDYNNPELPGSARAVDEFLRTHPEYRLRVQHTLAIISKTKAR